MASALLQASISNRHHFSWHDTGQSLLNAKLEAIAAAKVSVCIEVFTFSASEIGGRFREALAAAARRGVCVRLIVDAVGSFSLRGDYFTEPTRRIRRQLAQAVARGARVRLLLAGKSDVRMMQLASRSLYRRLLREGIEIWEYQPQVLHAKLIIIDDVVFVGSSNLDPRSLRINFEIMLRIKDAALVDAARQQFEADLVRHAIQITGDSIRTGRSWWQSLCQRLAYWLFARLDPELAALKLHRWHGRKERLVRRIKRRRRPVHPTVP